MPMQNNGRSSKPRRGYRSPGSNSDRSGSSLRRRPEGNALANAKRNYERYMVLARAAAQRGDTIETENCYQHAEHYLRVMREPQA